MIGTEIEMCSEEHGDWDIVQAGGRHGITGLKNRVKVMSVPVITDKGINRKPNVSFECIPILQWSLCIWRITKC
jgi:hypothetical protein